MSKNTKASREPQRESRTLGRFKGKCDLSLKAGEGAGMDGNKKRPLFLNSPGADLSNSLHQRGEAGMFLHSNFQNL